jgi:hypothetical protein
MAVVAGLLLPASLAFADHVTGVASYTACVNRRGEVYNLTQGTNTAEACRGDDTKVHLSGGDITAVTPGTGLAGGGPEGDVTLSVDPAVVQSRVTGQCTVGSAIQSVNQDGTVTCQPTGAAPTHLSDTESVFGANLDLPTNPVVCQTTDHTPTTATVARIDSWAALEGTGLMSYTVRNVVSTNGGATWISLDPEFARDSTPAVGQWGHAANSSIRNLVAGTTYRFGVMLGLDNGPNPSAGRCEVMVEIG